MDTKICIFGAGAIGCYLGGCLQAAGYSLDFIGREKTRDILMEHGLALSDYRGRQAQIKPEALRYSTHTATAKESKIILVTVKSGDSETVAAELKTLNLDNAIVVSLQNGINNAAIFKNALPDLEIIPAMVPFNVVQQSPGHFHQGTEGNLMVGDSASAKLLKTLFSQSGIELEISADIRGVQYTKLLMNLNNAVNALSGVPLLEQIHDRNYRKIMAATIEEGLQVLKSHGIKPRRVGKIVPATLPFILRLPTPLFKKIAHAMLAIDPKARSSMYEDLCNQRETEIDFLNGEIVRLAKEKGIAAPYNAWLVEKIKQAQRHKKGSPRLSPADIARGVTSI